MNGPDVFATGVHADRMLAAMRFAGQALASHGATDEIALRRLCQPGTELQVSARELVQYLKGVGRSPEQVLVTVKQSVARLESVQGQFEMRALKERVISLCIDEYYRA